jgi:hypothetical protein
LSRGRLHKFVKHQIRPLLSDLDSLFSIWTL